MSLSCSCDWDDAEWYYELAEDFSTLNTKRSRKCPSCKTKLNPGDCVLELYRYRDPIDDIEESIYGDQKPLASWYLCETCGGLHMAVIDLGMCCSIEENIANQIREYRYEENYWRSEK